MSAASMEACLQRCQKKSIDIDDIDVLLTLRLQHGATALCASAAALSRYTYVQPACRRTRPAQAHVQRTRPARTG